MEFLEIPIFDDDFYKMLVRFALNLFFLTIIIKFIHERFTRDSKYVFTFYTLGIVIFFICFTLKKFELDLGMALGLFAIFGILRYRTIQLETREMTYLFAIIGISIINALSNKKMSYTEIVFANTITAFAIYALEKYRAKREFCYKTINYEVIENIQPANRDQLLFDLEGRLGLKIIDLEIGNVDFLKDTANIKIKYQR